MYDLYVKIWYKNIVLTKYVQPQWLSGTYSQMYICRRLFESEKINGVFVEWSMCFWCSIQCTGCQHFEKSHLFAITFTRNTYIHTRTNTKEYMHTHLHAC